ncbi:hypothetical protein AVEN_162206-1 [Araneus ventricosus]|uniref:Uncharacterized protein n=1 Tax=Araneus ventricosus TaxID=182803 RepID=A0A4Y2FGR3_ARAVE|nr:hypothetical protein AVEN_162206-1 [Araneus ventricosus]
MAIISERKRSWIIYYHYLPETVVSSSKYSYNEANSYKRATLQYCYVRVMSLLSNINLMFGKRHLQRFYWMPGEWKPLILELGNKLDDHFDKKMKILANTRIFERTKDILVVPAAGQSRYPQSTNLQQNEGELVQK